MAVAAVVVATTVVGTALVVAVLWLVVDRGPSTGAGSGSQNEAVVDPPEVVPDDDAAVDDTPEGPGGQQHGVDPGPAEPPQTPPSAEGPLDRGDLDGVEPGSGTPSPSGIRFGEEPRGNWDVTGVAATDRLNVRTGPGVRFPVSATVAADAAELESTGRIAWVDGVRWREIVVPGATTGWVHGRYLTVHEPGTTPTPPDAPEAPTSAPDGTALPASLRGAEWSQIPTTQKVVALTFDAGANADGVPSILRTLQATNTPATFFLTGRWTENHPGLARDIATRYPIGNHSVTHPNVTSLSDTGLRAEVTDAEAVIQRLTGHSTRPWFRFPYGDRDARTIRLVNELGYGSIRWTVDTLGWKGTSGGMTATAVVGRVVDTARPGQIVLLHVGSHPTDRSTLDADALPDIIEQLRAKGYRFVTLPDALVLADR